MVIHSSILQSNGFFISYLSRFLKPAVGLNSYWKLCYRASSHGWAARTFHSRCDGKPHTVTIIRKSQYVFGGYTDIAWGKNTISKIAYALLIMTVLSPQRNTLEFAAALIRGSMTKAPPTKPRISLFLSN